MRYVMVLVPNSADARDVVQETAVALWEKIEHYDRSKPFVPWACRFALNEARMFLRKQGRRNRLAEEVIELLQEQRIASAERLDARRVYLQDCLRELPERTAKIMRTHYFDERSTKDLSERFGKSLESIYKTLQRTREALRTCIERKAMKEANS